MTDAEIYKKSLDEYHAKVVAASFPKPRHDQESDVRPSAESDADQQARQGVLRRWMDSGRKGGAS